VGKVEPRGAGKEGPESPKVEGFRRGDVFKVKTGSGDYAAEHYEVLKAPSEAFKDMMVQKLDSMGHMVGAPESMNASGFSAFLKDAKATKSHPAEEKAEARKALEAHGWKEGKGGGGPASLAWTHPDRPGESIGLSSGSHEFTWGHNKFKNGDISDFSKENHKHIATYTGDKSLPEPTPGQGLEARG
jgi:hypothetical protein